MNHEALKMLSDDTAEVPEPERWGADYRAEHDPDRTALMEHIEAVTRRRVERSPRGAAILAATHLDGLQKLMALAPVYHQIYSVTKQQILQEERERHAGERHDG